MTTKRTQFRYSVIPRSRVVLMPDTASMAFLNDLVQGSPFHRGTTQRGGFFCSVAEFANQIPRMYFDGIEVPSTIEASAESFGAFTDEETGKTSIRLLLNSPTLMALHETLVGGDLEKLDPERKFVPYLTFIEDISSNFRNHKGWYNSIKDMFAPGGMYHQRKIYFNKQLDVIDNLVLRPVKGEQKRGGAPGVTIIEEV